MKLSLHRSARFQRFLNTPHSAPVRFALGFIARIITRFTTREPLLAAQIYRRIAHENDFRLGLRLLSWYLCRRWPRLQLSNFHFFVFTHALDPAALTALRRFLVRCAGRGNHALWLCDCASASAALALLQPQTFPRFAADVDALLAAFAHTESLPSAPVTGQSGTFSPHDAQDALRDFADAFPISDLPWFVISGTFLGLIRAGGFLPHDHDIDLGIMAEAIDLPAFLQTLKADPRFRLIARESQSTLARDATGIWQTRTLPAMIKFAHANGTSFDLFVHHREGDVIWHGSTLYRWDNATFALDPHVLCTIPVLGPTNADRYLTENYGDWRVPVTAFHFSVDTTNLRVVANPVSIAVFLRHAAMTNAAARAALLRVMQNAGYLQADPQSPTRLLFRQSAFHAAEPDSSTLVANLTGAAIVPSSN